MIDERSIHYSIEHCITTEGKVERVTARGRSSQRAVIDAVAEQVPKWRFKPLMIDGRPTPWCPSTRVDVEFRWRARPG
ncbi:hypothetical protein [Enhygromyxa salina]|uniref:TonB C-terminal domain-containing protein n=1 Tax=Enhygromyxa salina TaxID=215803 RepID=A0A2S9Y5Y9_9BACT|nr:hypothetical protein [Enhygromyxa salina]PRQ00505.1 hypothetical protein ENSA7_59990 [Enhygromyxa salina]